MEKAFKLGNLNSFSYFDPNLKGMHPASYMVQEEVVQEIDLWFITQHFFGLLL